ncbi:SAM-dependent methyltransferase [Actinomadura sp. 3N407]|uniref:SAM-dependent methyltransferase n=1 Tax=Actinomadura sp. 3N407 TaxID=3457423 RepID=UPI003FCE3BBD
MTAGEFEWGAAECGRSGSNDSFDDGLDTTTPFLPRVWNYWACGKDNYPADQCFGECVEAMHPQILDAARYRIVFRARAARAVVKDFRIGQFLVAGVDLPLHDEVHDIAQRVDPLVRVVYADPDPWVMAHARALLCGPRPDSCGYVEAGLEDPAGLLEGAAQILDLDRPVGVLLLNSLDGLDDTAAAHAIGVLGGALPPGSCIAICHLTGATGRAMAALNALQISSIPGLPRARNPAAVRALFAGLEVVEPGVVPVPQWRPEPSPWEAGPVDLWCGIGRVRDQERSAL